MWCYQCQRFGHLVNVCPRADNWGQMGMGSDRSLNVRRGTRSSLRGHPASTLASQLYGRGYVSRWQDLLGSGGSQSAFRYQ
jgi:hypothetical protein